ncbi:Phenolic glucoside malonyltransferase [Melia azedarach]|uniref:Phenolic glucoside malonyltransferase n=1 Tax=Melia azedarach TaxID=155640 RepID=A0ACC1X7W6_MELAZ|nr:Phenolic glucoside malonyltransferase [Melia azedarach]
MAETIDSGVKILEVTKITPFTNAISEFSLPLTYFDTYWLKFPPVERLFFYEITDQQLTIDLFNSVILPKLNHSLSLTLLPYLPLAGNLMWPEDAPEPAIYYFENDGVSVTFAESNADFNILSGNGIRGALDLHPLTPQLSISDDKAAVIAIQVTLFPNQGFCIGISTHHAVLDGKSSTMFMKSWAYVCKQLANEESPDLLPEFTPCFDRSLIKDPEGLNVVYANHWLQTFPDSDSSPNRRSLKILPFPKPNSNLVRATFELTREGIKKLRNKVLSLIDKNEGRQAKELHLSTYVLTSAYVYVCLVKAKAEESNTGHGTEVKASDFMEENGVALVAEKLSDLINGLKGGVIEGSEDKIKTLMRAFNLGLTFLSVAGSNRFDVYWSDFGWGKPKKVEIVSIERTGAFSMAESRDGGGGGVEIGIVLQKPQMEVFAASFVDGLK